MATTGTLALSAPSAAGQYLQVANGLPLEAIKLLPSPDGEFWGRVTRILRGVHAESPATPTNVVSIRR